MYEAVAMFHVGPYLGNCDGRDGVEKMSRGSRDSVTCLQMGICGKLWNPETLQSPSSHKELQVR